MKRRFGLIGVSADQYTETIKPMVYNVTMQEGGDTAVIDIDGYIGRDLLREFLTGEESKNTVENLKDDLRSFEASKIIVNINSPGGDLSEGLIIKDMLQAKRGEVVTNLQGLSASAATAIHQAGNKRRMAENTSFMLIHRAMLGLMGFFNQNSTRSFTKDLETIDSNLISMYADRASASDDEIADLMDEGEGYGRWVDAEEALEMGFIDEIYDPGDEDDEDIDRMEARKKAVQNSLNGDSSSLKNLLDKYRTDQEELRNEETDAEEARSLKIKNEIFKQNAEVI